MAFNILIVDDSETVRAVIAKTLRLAKIPVQSVFEAPDGKAALDILDKHWIDLVFADLNMPVMTGGEMVSRMAEDGLLGTIPVIIVSTEGSVTRIEQLKSQGISAFVEKPFTPELLWRVVDQVLGLGRDSHPAGTLARVFCEMLDQFGSTASSPIDRDKLPPCPEACLMTQMSFIGHWTGTLEVAIPETLGKAIAGKLSHVDHLDQLSSSLVADALGELINVVCGHALTAMAGENVTFTPGLPRVHREGPEEWNRLAGQEETVGVMSEGSPLLVRMVLEGADLEARRGRG